MSTEFWKKLDSPIVSVIINVHNGEDYISDTLSSIFQQTFSDFELIVFNNSSTDSTMKILSTVLDPRLKVYESERFEPLYSARNLAMQKTNGDLIAFCDSDDLWLPTKLEEQVSTLNKTGDLIACTNFLILNERAAQKDYSWVFTGLPDQCNHDLIMNHPYIHMSSLMIDRRIFQEFGVYFNSKLTILGDMDFFVRALKYSNVSVINNFLTVYRYHEGNTGLLRFNELYTEGVELISNYRHDKTVIEPVLSKFEKRIHWIFFRNEIEMKKKFSYLEAFKSLSISNFIKLIALAFIPAAVLKKRSETRGIL
ncbi:glycosyltransferase family 2 protein [Gammaproteobacteria bacterium]|nr:glycosyltransferase family 2 protein [Gammaproteobacteria bacterium]